MKKCIWLNFIGLFVLFNVVVFLISCAKKKAEEIKKADASPSKPAVEVPVKPTKFTPQMVVAAFEKAADRMPPMGLAIPWPAMSGAEPCTGSYRPTSPPTLADPSSPSEPQIRAQVVVLCTLKNLLHGPL